MCRYFLWIVDVARERRTITSHGSRSECIVRTPLEDRGKPNCSGLVFFAMRDVHFYRITTECRGICDDELDTTASESTHSVRSVRRCIPLGCSRIFCTRMRFFRQDGVGRYIDIKFIIDKATERQRISDIVSGGVYSRYPSRIRTNVKIRIFICISVREIIFLPGDDFYHSRSISRKSESIRVSLINGTRRWKQFVCQSQRVRYSQFGSNLDVWS